MHYTCKVLKCKVFECELLLVLIVSTVVVLYYAAQASLQGYSWAALLLDPPSQFND